MLSISHHQEMEALIALRQQASGEKQKLTKSIKEVQKEIDEYDCQIKDNFLQLNKDLKNY